jgi:cytoskeletal protein RodZ
VSIGDTLAEARRQTGLTITQVAQRTRIRETIIRGIESGDFSACGGDFYARGHIRSIAKAIGVDPDPLIREYDAAHGAPHAIRAAEVFEPSTPISMKERRSLNWSAVMVLALVVIVGYVIYNALSSGSTNAHQAAQSLHPGSHPGPAASRSSAPADPAAAAAGELVIRLTVKSESCWVEFTGQNGAYLSQVTLPAGASKTWTFRRPVHMQLGNPGAVVLTVNGQNRGSPGTAGNPVTLSFRPGKQLSSG